MSFKHFKKFPALKFHVSYTAFVKISFPDNFLCSDSTVSSEMAETSCQPAAKPYAITPQAKYCWRTIFANKTCADSFTNNL